MEPIIQVENLGKKYNITHFSGRYVALRDVLTNIIKSPWKFLTAKAKEAVGIGGKEEFWALKHLNFEVQKGEVIGIIGKNGSGKSTLLKILSRITPPTTGQVKLRGTVGSLLEVGTGFHPELSGRENILLNGAILGMPKKEIIKKFDEIVEFSGVGKFLDTPVKHYSSGMYVRLAFSVAAHLEPDILIVDEVLAVGDIEFQKKCIGKMKEVTRQDGRTVFFVSHNMAMIQGLCDRCILLEEGRIIKDGDVDAVINYYISQTSNSLGAPFNEFPEDPKKIIQLRSVRMLNRKEQNIRSFSCDEEVAIEMICRSDGPLLGMYGLLQIRKPDGTIILESDSTDTLPNYLENLEKGMHTVRLTIPARMLAAGEYVVFVEFVHDASAKYAIDAPGIVCSFSMDDSATMRGNLRNGSFSTLLGWKITKN